MISVLLPTLRPQLIHKAIDTLLSGTINGIEIIVIADFECPENMPAEVKWHIQERLGIVAAINYAYTLAKGDYIFDTNDDCLIAPGALDEMVKFSKEHNDNILITPQVYQGGIYAYYGKRFAPFPFAHRSVFERINGGQGWCLDPAYHAFYSDPDISMQGWAKGIRTEECPTAIIHGNSYIDEVNRDNHSKYRDADEKVFSDRYGNDFAETWGRIY